jgi:hypothetical protein
LESNSRNAFGHPGFIGVLLAVREFPVMARDDAVTKPHIGRSLGFSKQFKLRGALSVKAYPREIV